MPIFDKWWNDTKKHKKRLSHWLPHLKDLVGRIGGERSIRYFTLFALPMIDVFMLVKEGILHSDPINNSIGSVRFCECDQEHFAEIKELIAREDAGFFGRLEDVVLYQDDNFSGQFPTRDSISVKLSDEGLPQDQVDRLQLKQTFFDVQSSFPYDYINLDFCDYYYPTPDMLKINNTLERIFDWQRQSNGDVQVSDFVLAVTCRYDDQFPAQAEQRLSNLIRENCVQSPSYKQRILDTRGVQLIDQWIAADKKDLFFSGWPKDIARLAKAVGWKMEVLEYLYYDRVDGGGASYLISCLVARFTRPSAVPDYLPTALLALDKEKRTLIGEITRQSAEGRILLSDLAEIVVLRNEQARRMSRPELPAP